MAVLKMSERIIWCLYNFKRWQCLGCARELLLACLHVLFVNMCISDVNVNDPRRYANDVGKEMN